MRYRELLERMLNGFALHEIITDGQGVPIDYIFLEVNAAFEKMTGLARGTLIGKRVTRVIPNIKQSAFDWIGVYGKVALTGETAQFESYSEALNRWYAVSAYSPSANRFAVVFDDIIAKKEKSPDAPAHSVIESV